MMDMKVGNVLQMCDPRGFKDEKYATSKHSSNKYRFDKFNIFQNEIIISKTLKKRPGTITETRLLIPDQW